MHIHAYDADLNPVLEHPSITNDDLDPLHTFIKRKPLSEWLSIDPAYKQHCPNHRQYTGAICREIRAYGGNSIINVFFRSDGAPAYKPVVCEVAKAVKAPFNRSSPVDRIERSILETLTPKVWIKMSKEEQRAILEQIGRPNLACLKGGSVIACQYILRAGGFASYQLMLRVANAIAWAAVGHGLPFAVNAALAKTMSYGLGPPAWAVSTLLTLYQIADRSNKVIIPSVVHIAGLRLKQSLVHCTNCDADVAEGSAFCSECGTRLQS